MSHSSYWLSTNPFPRFPSLTQDLETDVVIIGAGITGISAAYLLKKAGARVILLERERCARVDTGHTTAHLAYVTDERLHQLCKHFGTEGAQASWEAGAAAIDQIEEIVRERAIDCEFSRVPGFLHARAESDEGSNPGSSARDLESLKEDAELASQMGFDAAGMDAVPLWNQPGIRFANQAKFHPLQYLAHLAQSIPEGGSHLFENSPVEGFETKPLAIRAGTKRHRIHCQRVVVATHSPLAGLSSIADALLLQTKLSLVTSYVVGARVPRNSAPEALFWDTGDPYNYLRVDRRSDHDYAILGGEDCKTGQESETDRPFETLAAKLRRIFPGAEVQHQWMGQVVETNDGMPFIGENDPRQFMATGFAGNGFTLGTVSAMMACDWYHGRVNPWSELFAIHRKKFHGGAWHYLRENLDYPYYLIRDRLRRAEEGSPAELAVGEGRILRLSGRKVAAYRKADGHLSLRSAVCTHLGCLVRWNESDKTWDCPCHGSRFHPTGEVRSGPAEHDLKPIDWPEIDSESEVSSTETVSSKS